MKETAAQLSIAAKEDHDGSIIICKDTIKQINGPNHDQKRLATLYCIDVSVCLLFAMTAVDGNNAVGWLKLITFIYL